MTSGRSAQQIYELLWGARKPPSRGPKPSLSVDEIVRTAIDVADAEGLPGLSMRKIAERLSVTTMSLYRYVPSKDDLVELMIDAIAHPPPDPATMPEHWRDALHWWAHAQYAVFRRHPWLHQHAFNHPPMGPNNIGWMEYAMQAILRSGLPAKHAISVLLVITSYTMGEARQQAALSDGANTLGVAYEDIGAIYARIIGEIIAAGNHPALAEVFRSGAFGEDDPEAASPDQDFERGLTFILDGIEALVARSAAEPSSP